MSWKKYSLATHRGEEPLVLNCEWSTCEVELTDMNEFLKHLQSHVNEFFDTRLCSPEPMNSCLWRDCTYNFTSTVDDIVRHIFFHGFHTKIKCIGRNMVVKGSIGMCKLDSSSRNTIPELPESLVCGWENCSLISNNPELFYRHVDTHVLNFDVGEVKEKGAQCGWEGCTTRVKTRPRLRDHLRSHTQEKTVACPMCGGLFANKTKLHDHFKRQQDSTDDCFQCSHCNKSFATERLLRDHMRNHVNHYKCTLCDMTCPTPSALKCHVKFRHSDVKSFACETCGHGSKTAHDLRRHTDRHHPEPVYRCHVPDCEYESRHFRAMTDHFRRNHQGPFTNSYLCHICGSKFPIGYYLTRHLRGYHKFKWPSGHRKFRYRLDEDGFYRLQLVRYESADLILGDEPKSKRKRTEASEPNKSQDKVPVSHFKAVAAVDDSAESVVLEPPPTEEELIEFQSELSEPETPPPEVTYKDVATDSVSPEMVLNIKNSDDSSNSSSYHILHSMPIDFGTFDEPEPEQQTTEFSIEASPVKFTEGIQNSNPNKLLSYNLQMLGDVALQDTLVEQKLHPTPEKPTKIIRKSPRKAVAPRRLVDFCS